MKTKQFLFAILILALGALSITLNTGCGGKKGSSDSTKTETPQANDNVSIMKKNVKDYICKKVIYFPETYESLKFNIDTVYVNTGLIAQKKEKESNLEQDKSASINAENFIKNYDSQDFDALSKGTIYYSNEKNQLASLKSEISNLQSQISELDKQIGQNKNVIQSYNVFHAFNAKDKENKLSVTEANIAIDKDLKVISYTVVPKDASK
ncbi:MAG: hypothetical protein ABR968_15015 [Bacteroidales bacterium]|jgi:hypothetical protein